MVVFTSYEDLLRDVLDNGDVKTDRTGTGTLSVFGRQIRSDLAQGFPLVTTKKVHLKSIVGELLFFLGGHTNSRILQDQGIRIWNEWGDSNGNLGPIYSHQWRNWGGRPKSVKQPTPRIPDGLTPSVYGVANARGYDRGASEVEDRLFVTWKAMLSRCYNPSMDKYAYYGAKGVSVCDEWLAFDNFSRDAKLLAGWVNKSASWSEYQIDKDIHGTGFIYSPHHCTWVTREENMAGQNCIVYELLHTDGRLAVVHNPAQFRREHGISQGNFSAMLRGERKSAGGWSVVHARDVRAGIDQISQVVDQIKANPDSRRLIVSAWNPSDVDVMALPPCHALFQFYVADGKLSCQLYQRSADMLLGVPFNIASYALLTHMVAAQAGLEVGEFIWTGGDCHIYSNHLEQVREQLSREPREAPRLVLADRPSLFDYQIGDVAVTGYDPHPAIRAAVAV